MSSDKLDEYAVSDQALIREVLPNNWPKRVARLMAVPTATAKHWVYVRIGTGRRAEVARQMLAVMDEQDRRRAVVRRQLEAIAYGEGAEGVGDHPVCCACGRHRRETATADRAASGEAPD
jgi:hypothetical protein